MPALINMPRAAWKRQPSGNTDVVWNNPLTNNLFVAINFNNTIRLVNSVKQNNIGTISLNGSTVASSGKKGICIQSTLGSLDAQDVHDVSRINSGPVSHFGLVNIAAIGSWGGIFSVRDSVNNSSFSIYKYSSTNHLFGSQGNTSGIDNSYTNNFVNVLLDKGTVTYLCSSSGPFHYSTVDIYVDKEFSTSTRGAASPGTQAGPGVFYRFLGGRDTAVGTTGKYFLHYGWRRFVSAAEYAELSKNPWQLFAPAPSRFYLIPSALPTLSSPTAINITAGGFQPRVTATY